MYIQGWTKIGLMNYVSAVAYHFCLNLPAAFTQPGFHSFGNPCTALGASRKRPSPVHPRGNVDLIMLPQSNCNNEAKSGLRLVGTVTQERQFTYWLKLMLQVA